MAKRNGPLWDAAYCAGLNAYMSSDQKQIELIRSLAEDKGINVAFYISQCAAEMADLAVTHKLSLSKETSSLKAQRDDLLNALEGLQARYLSLVNSGDCGFWDPEKEDEIKASRAAIAKVRGKD